MVATTVLLSLGAHRRKLTNQPTNHQTAVRMTEFMAIDLAMVEVNGGKVVWDYFLDAQDADGSIPMGGLL